MKNGIIKKFCILILIICIVSGNLVVYAEADGGVDYPAYYEADLVPPAETLKKYADTDELRAYLFEEFSKCTTDRIDLGKFAIDKSDVNALKSFIWSEMPELFHVAGLRVFNNGTTITAIAASSFKYAETKEQYDSMLAECEEKAAVLLNGIEGNDSLSDVEKALLLHDRLAANCSYSFDTNLELRYTMYGALALGLAVCDGYTHAYSYLLRRVGIDSIKCDSDALNHSWNLVLIDGNYYHVDVTWDDPSISSDSRSFLGYVRHEYFLLSDKEIKARKHDADDYYDTMAKSTKYDNYFWMSSETEFQLVKGRLYYYDSAAHSIMRLNDDGVSGTALCSVSDVWWASDRSFYWDGNYTRLSSDGVSLYFSTSDTIFTYNLNRGEKTEIFKPELKDGDLVYGFTYRDGNLVIDINDRPSGKGTRLKQIMQPYTPERIKVKLTTEFSLQSSQTVTADMISSNGTTGYYFGKNREYTENDIVKTAEHLVKLTVTEPGTYYFTAFDESGESSEEAVITFCMITLHTNGGKVECEKILFEEKTEFNVPVPQHEELHFCGWATTENAETGEISYKVTYPLQAADLYAVWTDSAEFSGTVRTAVGEVVNIVIRDADGNTIGMYTTENGEFLLELTVETAFIEITAPGCIGQIYRAESFPGAGAVIALQLLGDMDGDEELNNKDVTGMFRMISKSENEYSDVADVNGDNENDNKDVIFLFRYLSNPELTLVTHSVFVDFS